MKKVTFNENAEYSLFESENALSELHIIIKPKGTDIKDALEKAGRSYNEIINKLNIKNNSLVFSRIYCKNINNIKEYLQKSDFFKNISRGSQSIIQQPPLNGSDIVIYLYHIYDRNNKSDFKINYFHSDSYGNGTIINAKNYSLLFLGNLTGSGGDIYEQTSSLFMRYSDLLKKYNQEFSRNFIRSWIFVSDIDDNYNGMVEARKKYFFNNGITQNSFFPASTGIGCIPVNGEKVTADFLSLSRIKSGQIIRMEAQPNMDSPYKYGVTFERGLKIIFGDRIHMHISGTASIDIKGNILYKNDIVKQTKRTIENIKVLLNNQNSSLNDIAYFNVYLRESSMVSEVKKILDFELEEKIPYIIVNGPVCRQDWLVEIDGISVKANNSSYPPFL